MHQKDARLLARISGQPDHGSGARTIPWEAVAGIPLPLFISRHLDTMHQNPMHHRRHPAPAWARLAAVAPCRPTSGGSAPC
jgi:hypothetical protein